MPEFLLYGLAKDATERWQEDLLATGLPTREAAEPIKTRAAADGFHSFRVAEFKGGQPDFAAAVLRR